MNRPAHLQKRQITRTFAEDGRLLRPAAGTRNEYGEWSDGTYAESDVKLSTVPVTQLGMARRRQVTEAGIRLDASRVFWTAETVHVAEEYTAGDLIEYEGERWRVSIVQRWGHFFDAIGVREEPQPERGDDEDPGTFQRDLERKVRAHIAAGSKLPTENILPGNDPGPRPHNAFATCLLMTDRNIGYAGDKVVETEDNTEELVKHVRASIFSIQWYRRGATERALEFVGWADTDIAKQKENIAGFRIQYPLQPRRMDELIDDQYGGRASLDLHLHYSRTTVVDTGRIDIVPITIRTEAETITEEVS